MKRVVMPVRWQCAKCSAGIVEPGPALGAGDIPVHLPADTFRSAAGCYPFLTDSSFHSY